MNIKKIFVPLFLIISSSCGNIVSTSINNTSNSIDNFNNIITAEVNEDDVNVIIFGGQSNMEGNSFLENLYQNCSQSDTLLYKNGFTNTKIGYGNDIVTRNNFSSVKEGQGQTNLKFGPELGFAKYFYENFPNQKTYIIKYAVSATTIYEHWTSPTSVKEEIRPTIGFCYNGFVNYVNKMLNLLKVDGMNPIVRAICWMQGESDSSATAFSYYENLENNLINDFQREFDSYSSDIGIRFIDAGISNSSCWTFYKEINNAKRKNQEKDPDIRFYIDTIAENLEFDKEPSIKNVDIYHYDSLSMIKLGVLFAKKYSEIMGF